MSKLGDFLHSVVDQLTHHSEAQVQDKHSLVDDAIAELEDTVKAVAMKVVKKYTQDPGVKTPSDVQTPQGTATEVADNTGSE